MKISLKLAGIAVLAAAMPAFAQVTINPTLSVTGWAVASYRNLSLSPGGDTDSSNVDAALLQANITPVKGTTATVSMYYVPSSEGGVSPSGSEVTLLDAYVAYDAGGGVTLTAGKFLSYLGYESFYLNQDNMITLANQQILAPIPGYHEGVKLDYSPDKTDTLGFAIVDSLNSKPGYAGTEGDGEFRHNAGGEAYYTNTAVNNLTLWFGAGYDTKGNFEPHSDTVLDVWASYTINKNSSIAAEEIYKDGGDFDIGGTGKGSNWLVYYNINGSANETNWFCVSGEDVSAGEGKYIKYSFSPQYKFNANLAVKGQYSYTSYSDTAFLGLPNNSSFIGAEVVFSF